MGKGTRSEGVINQNFLKCRSEMHPEISKIFAESLQIIGAILADFFKEDHD